MTSLVSTTQPSEDLSPVSAYAEERLGIRSQLAYPLYDGESKILTDWFRKQDSPVGGHGICAGSGLFGL